MLADVVRLGREGEYRDYISAEQAVMAIDLLILDTPFAESGRGALDDLYRLVRNDDDYQPEKLRASLARLAAIVRQEDRP